MASCEEVLPFVLPDPSGMELEAFSWESFFLFENFPSLASAPPKGCSLPFFCLLPGRH